MRDVTCPRPPISYRLLLLLRHFRSTCLLLLLLILHTSLLVICFHLVRPDHPVANLGLLIALPLQHPGSDKPLDLRGLHPLLATFQLHLAANDEITNIILLLEVEQLPNVRCSLGTQATRLVIISQSLNLLGALLQHH